MRRSSRLHEGPAPGRRTRRAALTVCLSAAALGATATPALAVDPTVFTDNAGDGVTLREAIANTAAGGSINLAAGTYQVSSANTSGPEDGNATGDLDLTKNVTINGAGLNSTFIRSTAPGPVDGVLHVLASTTLNNLAVVGGVRQGSEGNRNDTAGGGIRVGNFGSGAKTGVLVANGVQVGFNEAYQGGGVYVGAAGTGGRSSANFTNSVIYQNTGYKYGGGITAHGDVLLTQSSVLSNTSNGDGGGLFLWSSPRATLTATNTTIGDNFAATKGGALQTGGTLAFNAVTFAANAADLGKNIMFDGGSISVRDTIFGLAPDNQGRYINGCNGNTFNPTNGAADITSTGYNIESGFACIGTDTTGDGEADAEPQNPNDRLNVPDTGPGGLNLAKPVPSQGIYHYALLPGSAAQDTGRDFCRDLVDQLGTARPQGPRCDIGAIEQLPPTLADVGIETYVENPDPATAGDDVTYEAVIRNVGTGTADDVVFRTSVPTDTSFVSASTGCSRPRPDALRCELGNLAPGQAATVLLTVKTTKAGILTNRGDVSARAGQDVNAGNNQLSTSATINPRVDPDPELTVGLVKAVKRTAKSISFVVGLNRDRSSARVALFTKRFGTLVIKTVRFDAAGTKTVKLKLSKSVRKKLKKLKKGTRFQVRVDAELPGGGELSERMGLRLTKSGKIRR